MKGGDLKFIQTPCRGQKTFKRCYRKHQWKTESLSDNFAGHRELRKIPQESTLCSEPNYLLCAYIKLEICCQGREETRSVQQTEGLIKQGCRRTHLRSLTPFFFAFTNTIVYSLRKTCQHDSLQMCFGNQHDSLHYRYPEREAPKV